MSDVGVIVTRHALAQAHRRDPEFAASTRNLVSAMFHEVQRALAEQRVSTHQPAWARRAGRHKSRRSERIRATRFVTNEQDNRCYVLTTAHQQRDLNRPHQHRKTWVVLTFYARPETREERAA